MIKVVIVDDSAVVRKILKRVLEEDGEIKVVGSAPDPYVARDMIVKEKPDVITLDIEMPRMDGLTFLAKLMRHFPMPVIIISSLTRNSRDMAIKAMELGAVDVISKPGSSFSVGDVAEEIVEKIKAASRAIIKKKTLSESSGKKKIEPIKIDTTSKIVAIGASTGGTEAIKEVLENLPSNFPGVLVAQHMPPGFTQSFAERLDELCNMHVKEAEEGEPVSVGKVLIAPGNYHLLLKRSGARYSVRLNQGPRVHYQRPSCDVLFKSVASEAGKNSIGVILTGMGADGAAGLKMMHESGAYTIGQDEKSSVVYGMPKAAYDMGAVNKQFPLKQISRALINVVSKQEYYF